MDEFELIERCFRGRTAWRPGTVLGIGDDAALLDTAGRPLANARATVSLAGPAGAGAAARHVFGAALIRLAARAVTPRWATLGITLEAVHPDWIESFSASAAEACDACGVELVGGDTTRGPGRATVFALGARAALPRRSAPRPSTAAFEARLALPASGPPARAIEGLVSACTDLASRGADIRCVTRPDRGGADIRCASRPDRGGADIRCASRPDRGGAAGTEYLELVAHCDAAGVDALRAVGRRAATRIQTTRDE